MRIQNNDITPANSQNSVCHPITYKLYCLNFCTILWCTKKILFQIDDFSFLSLRKKYTPALIVPPLSHLTSCTPTKSTLYLANFLATVVRNPDFYRFLTFHVPNLMSYQWISPSPKQLCTFRNMPLFYGEGSLAWYITYCYSIMFSSRLSRFFKVTECIFENISQVSMAFILMRYYD